MTYVRMFEALICGRRVRHKDWSEGHSIQLCGEKVIGYGDVHKDEFGNGTDETFTDRELLEMIGPVGDESDDQWQLV